VKKGKPEAYNPSFLRRKRRIIIIAKASSTKFEAEETSAITQKAERGKGVKPVNLSNR